MESTFFCVETWLRPQWIIPDFMSNRTQNHRSICSCPANFLGDPFTRCYPECTQHDECRSNQACFNLKCVDPCIGACGTGAECRVENHKAICSCPKGYPEFRNIPCFSSSVCYLALHLSLMTRVANFHEKRADFSLFFPIPVDEKTYSHLFENFLGTLHVVLLKLDNYFSWCNAFIELRVHHHGNK